MPTIASTRPLHIGAFIFPRMDQIDFTGPFEVLSRVPNSTFHVIGRDRAPVRDIKGLILTPEKTFSEVPQLDVLVVPGGYGQQDLMDDEVVLSFLRNQAAGAEYVFFCVHWSLDLRGCRITKACPFDDALGFF